jgi:hypothetical protein
MNFTNRHNIYRSPDPDGSGGGADNVSAPAGNESASATPAFDPQEFETRFNSRLEQETGRIRSEYEEKLRGVESRLPKQETKQDQEPSMEDFLINGEMTKESWSKYQAAVNGYHFKKNVSEYERERSEKGQEAHTKSEERKIISSHQKRSQEYKAANPDFNPTQARFDRDVALAIAESDYSPHILHYLQKNPDKMAALREMEETNIRGAVRFIGRLESQFENQESVIQSKVTTAKTAPTAGAFGTGKGASKNDLTPEKSREIYG